MCLSITGYYVLKITGTFGLLHDPIDYRHTKYIFFFNKFFMLRRHLKKGILQSFFSCNNSTRYGVPNSRHFQKRCFVLCLLEKKIWVL